jgi:uncharacterized protein YeaO (DUF488 family)
VIWSRDPFDEFARRYREELKDNPAVPLARTRFHNHRATLLYGAHDPEINHAVVLADVLRHL